MGHSIPKMTVEGVVRRAAQADKLEQLLREAPGQPEQPEPLRDITGCDV